MQLDKATALVGISEFIEDRLALPAREAYSRLVEVEDLRVDTESVTAILADYARDVITITLESLEANGIQLIGR